MSNELTVTKLVEQSHKNSADHGFWDTTRTIETIPSKLALIMSEAGEALESYRDPNSDEMVPVPSSLVYRILHEEVDTPESFAATMELDELFQKWQAKPKGFDIELADIIIRVCDLAGAQGIDLEAAINTKHEYNRTRPLRHGRVV